jgi:hypothetical protein
MRKYTKSGEKRYEVVSHIGYYTKPKRILETSQNRGKKGSLAGKIFKQYRPLMSLERASKKKRDIITYIEQLEKIGITVFPTKARIIPTRRNGKFQLILIQESIPSEHIMNNYIRNCTDKEAVRLFEKTINMLEKIRIANQKGIHLSIDSSPKNLAVINGEPVLIDLYPVFLNHGKDNVSSALSGLRSRTLRVLRKLLPTHAEKYAHKKIGQLYNVDSRQKSMLNHFSKTHPTSKAIFNEILDKIRN